MKYICTILFVWMSINNQAGGELYTCKNARISLFSSAPIEDISAFSTAGTSVFNATTGQLDFSIAIRSFQFEKSVMQEHFNSDYMESDKFPRAIFKGKLDQNIDVTKDGTYPVKVFGELNVHGVTQSRTISGTVSVKGGIISMKSEFIVKCADHRIDIPQIVFHHIAENIQMSVIATYAAYKK